MHRSNHTHFIPEAKTLHERMYSIFIGPVVIVCGAIIFSFFIPHAPELSKDISFFTLISATISTLLRLCIAYVLALIVAVPLAYIATENKTVEKIMLPVFDIFESVPVLAFFPLVVLFFINIGFPDGAAISIIFLSILWNIVFTVVGGLRIIPKDIIYASKVFKIRGWKYIRLVMLPSIFPEIVMGSILAVAQGWNLIIVAEIIHLYIPFGSESNDLFGIGSVMVNAGAQGNTTLFITCLFIMITCIALLNYFVWQKLMKFSEKFKFE